MGLEECGSGLATKFSVNVINHISSFSMLAIRKLGTKSVAQC